MRELLATAAREAFAEKGYAGTSTKDIAIRAGVAEVLIFRYFGTKAGLFDGAVLDTFEQFIDQYAVRWSERGARGESVEDIAREYIAMLYAFFEENRALLVALLSAKAHHPSTALRLNELFARLENIVREATREYGIPSRDAATTVRLTFGMVLSTVIHADVLFAGGPRLSERRLVDELTAYTLQGISDSS
ncbi:hypothetical protein A5692_09910 [Mycobacterium sp. E342]|uniref:TetR/AcrR family transcriptional regulator n=1 Tax=unclassified Mycobacterium TaxID=2642494 RepID=UPI0007FF7087|nr:MULTISPECIES: TetR/AcrR family transcriptional regulator [unclassified Mycobacterium]OBH11758.1 hypothetical protein A9X04_18325 [Mycobacterium sp. E3247]OBH37726.1 hypothetical protein A5692_09910 [Mycobacterium sp. E342]